jgi:serine/threonine-protein kinase
MPFVEGETLRDRINREKQLPVADAVRITTEVAAALDYAHRHGVVHRDIKPENILLHDGSALVADFGIALAASKASGSRMTETGMSLGTPHYMSPEQAMGEREITARSDVYALGAVLYEMLTGEPPFTGATAQAVVARVVTETPRPLHAQRHTIPPHVEAAVMTALEKLPADRFGTAAEFAEALAGRGTTHTRRTAATGAMTGAGRGGKTRLDPVKIGLAGAMVGAAALAAWGWLRPGPAPMVNRFSLYLPPEQALAPVSNSGNRVAISPDGRRIVYSGPAQRGTQLWVREHDQLTSTPISGTENAGTPFFSPDGRRIGFVINGSKLRTVSLDGGPTQSLTDSANTTGGDWGPDGYVYFEVDSGIARIRASGGPIEPLYNFFKNKETGAEWPVLLPGGKGLLFRTRRPNQAVADFQIVAMPLPHGEPRPLMRGVYARYSPTGHLLVVTADGKLVAAPFDLKKLELSGPAIGLLEGIGVEVGGFSTNLALSDNGTLVYTTGSAVRSRQPIWVTRQGVASPVDSTWEPQGGIAAFALAPDGRALAVDVIQNGVNVIWIKRIPTGPYSRLTFGDTANLRPTWSADGRSLVYVGNAATNGGTPMMRRADGTGAAQALVRSRFLFAQAFETHDGKWILARRSFFEEGSGDIYGVRKGDSTLVPLVTGPATEAEPAVSPNGRWLAYTSLESGVPEVYVRPFPDAASARWQVSTAGGGDPVWSHSGRELFYRSANEQLMTVAVHPGASFSFEQPKPLFSTANYVNINPVPSFDVSPDDKRFLFLRETASNERNELIVVQNWTKEMKARARR